MIDIIIAIMIGYGIGILFMSLFKISKINDLENEIILQKTKIQNRIAELEFHKSCTINTKVHTLSDTYNYIIKDLERLL